MEELNMAKIDWITWAKMGLAVGLLLGLIVFVITTLLGLTITGIEGILPATLIGGLAGLAVLIGTSISGAISFVVGRIGLLLLEKVGLKIKGIFWKIFGVAFLGSLILAIIVPYLSGLEIILGMGDILFKLISALISAWIVIFVFKKLKWKLPRDGA
jgi:hypothetical protein